MNFQLCPLHSKAMKLRGPLRLGEYTLTVTRAHGIELVRPTLYLLAAMVSWSFSSALGAGQEWVSYPALGLAVILLVLAVRDVASWALTGYLLTNERLVIRRGVSMRNDLSVPLNQLEGVRVGPKVLMGVVAAAPLTIYGRASQHVLPAVPDPERFSALIRSAQQQYLEGSAPD